MKIDKAYEILDLISEKNTIVPKDIKMLLKLSQHDNSEIRSCVAELLVSVNDSKAEMVLINMCNDEDELVRVNACDSISKFATDRVYNQLIKNILYDKSTLVKSYAILSIIDIMNYLEIDRKELKTLLLCNSKATELNICAACFKGLYVLGEEEYLNKLLDLVESENYQDRCLILNIIEDIITEKNRSYILSVLKKLRKTEPTNAVISTIDRIINENG